MPETPSSNRLRPLRETLTWPVAAGSVALTLVATLLALWLPRLLGDLVDALVEGDLESRELFLGAGFYLGVALAAGLTSRWMRQVPMRWGPRVGHILRTRLHEHLLDLDEHQVRSFRVGELMSRLQSDVRAVADMLSLGGHSLIRAGFTLGLSFTLMFQRSAQLAWVLAGLLPLLVLLGFVMMHSIRRRHLEVQEQLGVLTSYCQESFSGLRVVRSLGLERLRGEAFRDLNQDYVQKSLSLSRIEIFSWPVIHVGFVVGNILLLWFGGRMVIEESIPLGMLVEFQQYLMMLQWPALSVAWTLTMILRGRASLQRLQEIMATEPQIRDMPASLPASSRPVPAEGAEIRFEHVSLWLEGVPVLRDISFTAAPDQWLGITGPTGSGKTLLLQLLLRRHDPQEGRILLGDVPLTDYSREALYQFCRIAPQEPMLFSMSLAENLRLARRDADESLLQHVLTLSALEQDLPQLPLGLETKIGERGVTLSGGQRQRSSLARALLSDPPLLLLDDTFSAVDSATEARILERLLPARRGKGLWMVSHRFAALRQCSKVLVLREGRLVQVGAPEELLCEPGPFMELAERQRLQAQLEEADD